MSNLPTIANIEITQDQEGRFNLNALHRASGLGANKAPAQWLRTKQAQDIVSEIENQTVQICIVTKEGKNGGTFAHELLAISYAGWISPSFQLKVNQVFLEFKSGKLVQPQLPDFTNPAVAARAWADQHERADKAETLLIEQKPKIKKYDRLLETSGYLNLQNAMRVLGIKPNLGIRGLRVYGVLFEQGGNPNTPKREYIMAGYFVVRPSEGRDGKIHMQTYVTANGMDWLASFDVEDALRLEVIA